MFDPNFQLNKGLCWKIPLDLKAILGRGLVWIGHRHQWLVSKSHPKPNGCFSTALVATARGSRAYFPFAPLALERMCCPQVLGLTQFKTTTCSESKTFEINQVMLLFKTLKSQFHLNERSDLITCTPNTTNPNNFNKLLLRLFIVSDGHLQNQLSFLCFITCTCRFFSTATYSPRKKNTEYHPNYPRVFFFPRLLEKGAKKVTAMCLKK